MRLLSEKSAILLIYTGGTIGMKEDPVDGALRPFDFSQILEEVPELRKYAFKIDSYTFDPLIDSSDVEPSLWQALAELIFKRYDEYDGFVILHGTDTMAYSASALSFMLNNLSKPVIFTGSQLPIGRPRTDGKENLVSAVEIASARGRDGRALVPEVAVFFNSQLLRGNRSTKMDSASFDAFASPNYTPLAVAGINIKYNHPAIQPAPDPEAAFSIDTALDTRVSILKIHPGITSRTARYFLCDPGSRAVIMETYGSGNAISKPWFIDIVREACESGKIIMNVSQCPAGEVDMNLYATGKSLMTCGVISGYDSTTEAALGKLFIIMGKHASNEAVKPLLGINYRGEISK